MDGLSAIARILKLEGVEWVACYPSNNLIEAVAEEGIRTVMFRHERGAVMAADGYSRANNRQKFGVVITQGASGAENAMGGIAQAFGDNVPILLLPGGSALAAWGIRPNFSPGEGVRADIEADRGDTLAVGDGERASPRFPRASERQRRAGYG